LLYVIKYACNGGGGDHRVILTSKWLKNKYKDTTKMKIR